MSVASQVAAVLEQTLDGDEVLVGSSRERLGFDGAVEPRGGHPREVRPRRRLPPRAARPARDPQRADPPPGPTKTVTSLEKEGSPQRAIAAARRPRLRGRVALTRHNQPLSRRRDPVDAALAPRRAAAEEPR